MSSYLISGIALLLAVIMVMFYRWRTICTVKRLDEMLKAAMNGHFTEETFDESCLSALESRFARYLMANTLSAQRVQEQKDQMSVLISDISHQTKTPVANLQLYAQLLAEQPLPPQGVECLQAILSQADKLQTLMEILVKTSRLENGILSIHPKPSELATVVARSVAQYTTKADRKKISLIIKSTYGRAVFDPKWTEEALCNLLDNAVKYTSCEGVVTVDVKNYEMFSAIRVTDTGPGISEAEQPKIFGRFYRGTGNYQAEGVGIGLYLTRQIVEKQGGYVKVKSVLGKGSIFSIYLPQS